MTHLDLQALRTFVTVVDAGSFSRAAPRVHRSQSAVSMQIRKLEEMLGLTLIDRTTRHFAITARGETVLAHARRLLAQHDEMLGELRTADISGTVRIGVMEDYACTILPPIFRDFERAYSRVRLEVTTGMTAKLLPQLGERFEMVLATQPQGTETGRVLRSEQTVWAFSNSAARLPDPPIPLAMLETGNLFRNWATEALDRAGLAWSVVYTSGSIAAVEAAAAAGIAVTVVKRGTARPDLRLLGGRDGLPPLPTSDIALHVAQPQASAQTTALARFLEQRLAQQAP